MEVQWQIAMVHKIPKDTLSHEAGLTLIEILVVSILVMILFTILFIAFNPVQYRAKARDEKRLSDLSTLDRMINEYNVDHNTYPDTVNTLRKSTLLPGGNSGPLQSVTVGWIKQNLSSYGTKLPVDPVNDATYYYSYKQNGTSYELDTVLEYYTDKSANDGGNSSTIYELGNNLTLL